MLVPYRDPNSMVYTPLVEYRDPNAIVYTPILESAPPSAPAGTSFQVTVTFNSAVNQSGAHLVVEPLVYANGLTALAADTYSAPPPIPLVEGMTSVSFAVTVYAEALGEQPYANVVISVVIGGLANSLTGSVVCIVRP